MQLPVFLASASVFCSYTQLKKNLNNTRNNIKSQIQNKKNGGIVELLKPTLTKLLGIKVLILL